MVATILDGTKIAAQIKAEVGAEVRQLAEAGLRPGLAVVLVGHNPASEIYVRNKVKTCEQLGILQRKAHAARYCYYRRTAGVGR